MNRIFWVKIPRDVFFVDNYISYLNSEECSRYGRLKDNQKKISFLTGRILLKSYISYFYRMNYKNIEFTKNKFGKIYFLYGDSPLYFNISYSKGIIVVVFSEKNEVGIDIEYTGDNYLEVIPEIFSAKESDFVYSKKNEKQKIEAFYFIWTRKEAFMKAIGKGFSIPPKSFSIPLKPDEETETNYNYMNFKIDREFEVSVVNKNVLKETIKYNVIEVDFFELYESGLSKVNF